MSEMVEKVARAVRAEITGRPEDGRPIEGDGADYAGRYTDIARAAIAAMREPTQEMLVGSGEMYGFLEGYQPTGMTTDECHIGWWQAMIDEPLR